MKLPLDIHTHHSSQMASSQWDAIRSFSYPFNGCRDAAWHSLGIHPMDEGAFSEKALERLSSLSCDPSCLMIGEVGLDKRSLVPFQVQMTYLEIQARLAESLKKPLVIHMVQSMNELIKLKRQLHPVQPWLIHGFRGKPQMAEQLLREGFSLSFGEYFNEDSLRKIPSDHLFLETDESHLPFEIILRNAAEVRGVSLESFTEELERNVRRLFPSIESVT